jgi:hypothetical protein
MSNAPTKKEQTVKAFNNLINNNKFVLLVSLVIAFFIWVAVAMYASPEESYTIYNIPITVNTENSLVSQKGYKNFWQSDEAIDVTVTGPRYLITSLTPDDIIVSANLNTVDSSGVSQLALRVGLRQESQDITISQQSKTHVDIYFDAELEKEVTIYLDKSVFEDNIAEGFQMNSAELPVTTVKITGPATEVNKVIRAEAAPVLPEDLLFETATIPLDISLQGNSASETVSINQYVKHVDQQEYFVKVNIDRIAELTPSVEFTGEKTGDVTVSFNTETIIAKIDTESGFEGEELPIMTIDYASLKEGNNKFTVKSNEIELPEGVKIPEEEFEFVVTINLTV